MVGCSSPGLPEPSSDSSEKSENRLKSVKPETSEPPSLPSFLRVRVRVRVMVRVRVRVRVMVRVGVRVRFRIRIRVSGRVRFEDGVMVRG